MSFFWYTFHFFENMSEFFLIRFCSTLLSHWHGIGNFFYCKRNRKGFQMQTMGCSKGNQFSFLLFPFSLFCFFNDSQAWFNIIFERKKIFGCWISFMSWLPKRFLTGGTGCPERSPEKIREDQGWGTTFV